MPFDWKPSRPTMTIGGTDIYRPARGNYALVHAQCYPGGHLYLATYDDQNNLVRRNPWISSTTNFRRIYRNPIIHLERHWSGHYKPSLGYVFEGFLYNLHNSHRLYYSFEDDIFDDNAPTSSYQFNIPNKSGSTREFVSSNSRVWLKLDNTQRLQFRPQINITPTLSDSAYRASMGLLGFERRVEEVGHISEEIIINDRMEISGISGARLGGELIVNTDWSAAVVEYGLP